MHAHGICKEALMPNRILREGILTSERINELGWEAEVFYRRLMSVVDDFGRFSAHPSLLRAALFPLKLDTVRDANMERLLASVVQARLVRVYEVAGKRYLELLDFKQQVRAKESKYPQSPSTCAADAMQAPSEGTAPAHLDVFGDEGEKGVRKRPLPRPEDVSEQVWDDWCSLRRGKKATVSGTVVSEARKEAEKAGLPLERFLTIWCARGSQGLQADWLKPAEKAAPSSLERYQ